MYCTPDDIREQLGERELVGLTDTAKAGVADEGKIARAIEDAGGEIDGYAGTRHALPLSPVPAIIRTCCVDLTIYNLYARSPKGAAPEVRVERYKARVRFLEAVATGRISLGVGDPEGTPTTADTPQLHRDNPPRLFGRSSLEGF